MKKEATKSIFGQRKGIKGAYQTNSMSESPEDRTHIMQLGNEYTFCVTVLANMNQLPHESKTYGKLLIWRMKEFENNWGKKKPLEGGRERTKVGAGIYLILCYKILYFLENQQDTCLNLTF